MKKIILLAACLFTISTATKAQTTSQKTERDHKEQRAAREKQTPEQRAQKHVDKINSEVTLTEEQKPKVYDLALTKVKKVSEIREKYKGQSENTETAKKEMDVVRKDFNKNLKAILTPEQLEKLKAKQKEMKDARKNNSLDHD